MYSGLADPTIRSFSDRKVPPLLRRESPPRRHQMSAGSLFARDNHSAGADNPAPTAPPATHLAFDRPLIPPSLKIRIISEAISTRNDNRQQHPSPFPSTIHTNRFALPGRTRKITHLDAHISAPSVKSVVPLLLNDQSETVTSALR